MNCGKHCTYQDYDNLAANTQQYLKCLDSGDPECLTTKLNIYLEFIEDFDYPLTERMRLKIKATDGDLAKIKRIIQKDIEELIHNVLGDSREHN